ncbi:hypothetical protein [Tenacibaculum sp. MAR_2009_124]|uniref:hypothetical protein n=1 Tax=Tenacibaculum sp. MAR_2009_124 TaxID=1250059 RepID=UPI00115F78A8|nr:hypothetical protein [Tenacibaculum sp. MAR_2009_124]
MEVFKTQHESLVKTKDLKHLKIVNQPIDDSVFLSLPHTNNKEVDSLINKLFTDFKTSKTSGSNSYGISYNKQHKGFEIKTKIGATQKELKKERDTIIQVKEKIILKSKDVIKHRIPFKFWLFWLLSIIVIYKLTRLNII